MGKIRSHIVQHTHWDREWYFTTNDALVLSEQLFTEVFDELVKNSKVNFCLDGQSSILDEYVELHPEKLPIIQKLVKEQRLFIGPWYTQTDALLVDGEAIFRNLMIGIFDTKTKYGAPMMVGYLPDTFGFNAQLPTYLNHAGIDNFIFWRGISFNKMVASPYFKWKGLGGQFVYAINFPFGYMTAMLSLESEEQLADFVTKRLDRAVWFNSECGNSNVIMPSGIDQKNIVRNIDQIIEQINQISQYEHVISDYPHFVECIRQKKEQLPSYQGEIRTPVYARVHRSIGSVRMKIKQGSSKLEQKILRRVEPLMVIAKKNGITIGNGLLIKLWKKLLECQAHDSIGGCISDNVAKDVYQRIKAANELADGIENMIVKRLAERLKLLTTEILLVNTETTPFVGEKIIRVVAVSKNIQFADDKGAVILQETYFPARKDVVKLVPEGTALFDEPAYYELIVRLKVTLPALGYKVIKYSEATKSLLEPIVLEDTNEKGPVVEISNDYYTIKLRNKQLSLKNGKTEIANFLEIVDEANAGDTYDFSPLENDIERIISYKRGRVIQVGTKKMLEVDGEAKLPLNLADRLVDDPEQGIVSFTLSLSLGEKDDLITGKLIIMNEIYSHRLRLKWNVLNTNNQAIAQIQTGFIKTENLPISENWREEYVEKPVPIYLFDKSISVLNRQGTFTFFSNEIKEYERADCYLYLTLMATTGDFGKPNLAWRPGRASGDTTNEGHVMMATPLAQEIGKHVFNFAFRWSPERFDEQKIALMTQNWLAPSINYQLQSLNFFIHRLDNKIWPLEQEILTEKEFSLKKLPANLIISAIYPAYYDADSYIIRLANPTAKTIEIPDNVLAEAEIINALEDRLEQVSFIAPYDLLSLKYKY